MNPRGGDGDDLQREIARLRDLLDAERRTSEQWRRVAEERRVAMERLRQRRIVRMVLAVASVVMPPARRIQRAVRTIERRLRRVVSGLLGMRHRLTARRRAAALEHGVRSLETPPDDARSVTAIVLTRDGRANLERLLPKLARSRGVDLEIVVVDNASGPDTSEWLAAQPGIRVLRNERNLSFSEANHLAARATDGEVVLFLNDDVEPLDDAWLARMLACLGDDTVAVGAQLVHPRRTLLDGRQRDVGVQHLGITLRPDGDGPPRARNLGDGADPDPGGAPREVAGATAACLLVSRAAYDAAGGFATGYVYGAEDVDLCWRLRRAGGRVVVHPGAVLWHAEGSTRHRDDPEVRARRQAQNWDLLADRHGPAMRRAVDRDRILAQHVLSDTPFRVGITVTRDLESAGYGDWYTAHELGDALATLGWHVHYLERYRDAWYDPPATLDAIVSLHDLFDVRRVARPGLTTLAWVRNWTDRWIGHPWFENLDVVVASSAVSARHIVDTTRHRDVPVLPLATNAGRFAALGAEGTGRRSGVVLTANHWGEDRGIAALAAAVPDLQVFGKGWEKVPEMAGAWRGHLPYEQLPVVYAGASIVVDQTAAPTRPWGALNSRVFDATAAGALVVTDQEVGAAEVFGDLLPVYDGGASLADVVAAWRDDPVGAAERAGRLREAVLREHTYERRAEQLRDLLLERRQRASVVVRIGAPSRREASNWGDTFFAESLVAEFRAAGHHAATQTMDEWHDWRGKGFDVSLHLKGRSRCPRSDGQVHGVWVISHPDEVDPSELEVADVVFVASERLAASLGAQVDTPVLPLLQATDERRFRPTPVDPGRAHDVLFVGNSRFVERPIVRDALAEGLPLTIYGANWERFVPAGTVADRFVPNEELPRLYSSAQVVLNDHWPDMRTWGLVSNRVFDVLACGGCLVSDAVPELEALFDGAVALVHDGTELRDTVATLLADPERRRHMGSRGRELVIAAHTFRHRVESILAAVGPLVGGNGDSPSLADRASGDSRA